jgi:hypothetical protein
MSEITPKGELDIWKIWGKRVSKGKKHKCGFEKSKHSNSAQLFI